LIEKAASRRLTYAKGCIISGQPKRKLTHLSQDFLIAVALGHVATLVDDDGVEEVHPHGTLLQRLIQGPVSHDHDVISTTGSLEVELTNAISKGEMAWRFQVSDFNLASKL